MDDSRKIVVVVEDEEAARTALRWALHNLLRYGDVLTLLHVFPSPRSRVPSKKKKQLRLLRLHGYQLTLSFKEICSDFFNTRIEIVVTDDDDGGEDQKIVAVAREIGPFALVAGLHDHSFLYKLAEVTRNNDIASAFNCRVLAIKQPTTTTTTIAFQSQAATVQADLSSGLPNMGFSQVEVSGLQIPEIQPQKIPYRICPSPYAIIWRSKKTRRKRSSRL